MRIAILGVGGSTIPPLRQGGTEWIVYYQAKGLSGKGHNVLLFAREDTRINFQNTSVEVVGINFLGHKKDRFPRSDPFMEGSRGMRFESILLAKTSQSLIDLKDRYDVVVNNMRGGETVFLPIAKMLSKPFVNVMHLNIFDELAKVFQEFNAHIITISNNQRKNYPSLNYLATVYNGVNVEDFPFNNKPDDYFLTVGSIGRHKNQGDAIRACKESGNKLILIGKIRDKDYYDEIQKDIDGKQIVYKGEVGFKEKVKLYQNAKGLLFPIAWEEPFGLVMIESMACGTPVIAYNHGAVSEVLINNNTGYAIDRYSQMVDAISKIDEIKREDCQKHVEENFTVEKMVDAYEKALLKLDMSEK